MDYALVEFWDTLGDHMFRFLYYYTIPALCTTSLVWLAGIGA